jgi:hypothetical protein
MDLKVCDVSPALRRICKILLPKLFNPLCFHKWRIRAEVKFLPNWYERIPHLFPCFYFVQKKTRAQIKNSKILRPHAVTLLNRTGKSKARSITRLDYGAQNVDHRCRFNRYRNWEGVCNHFKSERNLHFNLLYLLHLNSVSETWNYNLCEIFAIANLTRICPWSWKCRIPTASQKPCNWVGLQNYSSITSTHCSAGNLVFGHRSVFRHELQSSASDHNSIQPKSKKSLTCISAPLHQRNP